MSDSKKSLVNLIRPYISVVEEVQDALYDLSEENFEKYHQFFMKTRIKGKIDSFRHIYTFCYYTSIFPMKTPLYYAIFIDFIKKHDIEHIFKKYLNNFIGLSSYSFINLCIAHGELQLQDIKNIYEDKEMKMPDSSQDMIYAEIIASDNIEEFKKLVIDPNFDKNKTIGCNLYNKVSDKSMSLIQYAANRGSLNIFKYLYINDADLSDIMSYAISGGNIEIIQILELDGIKANVSHILGAVLYHRKEIFDWLFEQFAEEITEDYYDLLIYSNFAHAIERFCTLSNPNIDFHLTYLSHTNGFTELLILLLKCPSARRWNIKYMFGTVQPLNEFSLEIILNRKIIHVNAQYYNGGTLLYNLCNTKLFDICYSIELVLKIPETDVNLPNDNGDTPLIAAVSCENMRAVELLLSHPNINVNIVNGEDNPLMIAVKAGDLEMVKLLCSHPKIDINIQDSNLGTPLMLSCGYRHTDIAKYLLSRPEIDIHRRICDQDLKDHDAFTVSVEGGLIDIIKMIMEHPSYVPTSEHLAHCCYLDSDMVKLYLGTFPNIDINEKTNYLSPLIVSVVEKNTDVLEYLITLPQFDIDKKMSDGKTSVLYYACIENYIEIVKILLSRPDIIISDDVFFIIMPFDY